MRRRYAMKARAESAERTRASIIDGAHRLLNQPHGTALTLQEVAKAAAVSRATIYKSIGSRADLLRAIFEDQGRLIAYDRVIAAMRHPDPETALIETVRESCRAWAVAPDELRTTLALAATDREIGELVRRYERSRREHLATLVARVRRKQPPLASMAGDAAMLAMLTSFHAYDQLRADHDEPQTEALLTRVCFACFGLRHPARRRARVQRRRQPDS